MLTDLRMQTPEAIQEIVDRVWEQREEFVRWPKKKVVLMRGAVRKDYHAYTKAQKERLKQSGVTLDSRSNGPAVCAFKLAGGERPQRNGGRRQWSVHHIYDGKFPAPGRKETTHAVKDPRYFTHSAGLVAVHPIADALADEVPYFAWLLRTEAYKRFKFDPDHVFKHAG